MEMKKTVCYEDFGAIGDGVTDDSAAIRAAHEYANENKLDVVTDGTKTYYIGVMTKTIPILTNVNWNTSKFIIDDSNIKPEDEIDGVKVRGVFIFTVPSPGSIESIEGLDEWREKVNAEGGIKADTFKKIDVNFGEPVLLRLYNDEHKNYIRYGVNAGSGAIQAETILVDKDGNVSPSAPIMFDFNKITRIDIYKIDVEPLTIEGGVFTTYPCLLSEPQHYLAYARGIAVRRSNVTVRGVKHCLDREGQYDYESNTGDYGCPYTGFFTAGLSNNVVFENCTPCAHVAYKGFNGAGMGTYDISSNGTINLVYKNCSQEHDNYFNIGGPSWRWGVMGSSGNKSISFIGSKLTRFDAHGGVHNVKLVDSELRMIRTNGTGTFLMENCVMYNRLLIGLREDYGGSWDGDVILKNVTIEIGDDTATLFNNTWYNHYFGYPILMPETIIIDNLKVSSSNPVHIFNPKLVEQLENCCKDEIDGKPNLNKIVPPKKVIIRNNKAGHKFVIPETEYFKNTEFIFED